MPAKDHFRQILDEAHDAAAKAQEGMVENMNAFDCGFAWVKISGNDPLARWCRAELKKRPGDSYDTRRLYGQKDEPGWIWRKPGGFSGQSIGIHEAGARAFRDKLAEYGIRADVGSRLD